MEVHHVDLTISAVAEEQYPKTDYPEIALVGRSNVGKSSLTNVLINRKNFAHTSSQPGKTQTLNFYNVEDQLFSLMCLAMVMPRFPKSSAKSLAR